MCDEAPDSSDGRRKLQRRTQGRSRCQAFARRLWRRQRAVTVKSRSNTVCGSTTHDPNAYFVIEDPPNIWLSMHEAYIQSVPLTPSLLQSARDDALSALTPVMKPRAPWCSHM
jgi:hypothetical protein